MKIRIAGRRFAVAITLVLLVSTGCSSWKRWCTPDQYDQSGYFSKKTLAYDLLLEADRIESSHTGEVGAPSCYVWALQTLIEHRNGKKFLINLSDNASVAGQLYALGGLYVVDRAEFDKRLPNYLDNGNSMTVISGCIIGADPIWVVARDIESGLWPKRWNVEQL